MEKELQVSVDGLWSSSRAGGPNNVRHPVEYVSESAENYKQLLDEGKLNNLSSSQWIRSRSLEN